MRLPRRWLPLVAVVAVLGLWLGLDVWSSDARIERELADATTALSAREGESAVLHAQRIRQTLEPLLAKDVVVSFEQREQLVGEEAVIAAATRLAESGSVRIVALERVSVDVNGDRAEARGELPTSSSQSGDLHRTRRPAELVLGREDGRWRLRSVDIGLAGRAEPEPRP